MKDNDFFSDQKSVLYAYWAGSVIGPFVHILAVAHVLLWGLPSSIVGSIVSCSRKSLTYQGFPIHNIAFWKYVQASCINYKVTDECL